MSTHGDRSTRWPFQDPALSTEQRVDDLVSRLPVPDKVGLLFHPHGGLCNPEVAYEAGRVPVATQIRDLRVTHFALQGASSDARELAQFHNHLQRIAQQASPWGIPVTISSDPRHGAAHNLLTSNASGAFSEWPEPLGFGALGSEQIVRQYGEIVRREYLAVGIRGALHPQVDLVTEPRWGRAMGSFSEDSALTSRLGAAYITGLQGERLGPDSVAAMTKHFPGGGPQLDGLDPHFGDGREQVYPGGRREDHLAPFIAAIAAGTAQIMPYYGMPVGTDWDEVGFAFNKALITDLLRGELGFEGVVCTDWTLVRDISPDFPAKAWGVEHLDEAGRALMLLEAGVDQFGGENCVDVVLDLVEQGRVSQQRLDESVRRVLADKFRLGLFDEQRFVDEGRANLVVGASAHVQAARAAQKESLVLLSNGTDEAPLLPLARGTTVYLEGLDPRALDGLGVVVDAPEQAEVAILRTHSPDYSDPEKGWMGSLHQGSLEFSDLDRSHVRALAATVPTVLDVHLTRPAVLAGMTDATAILASFGTGDRALTEVLFGDGSPKGTLPFDLPRSMAAVEASRTDVAFDTADPLFRFGHGLTYPPTPPTEEVDIPALVPQVSTLHCSGGVLRLQSAVALRAEDDDRDLARTLLEAGTGLRMEPADAGDAVLTIRRVAGAPSSYRLVIGGDGITIESADRDGVVASLSTLRQLMPDWVHGPAPLPGATIELPHVEIEDEPSCSWRGMLLDVARHFMPLDFLYRYVDLLAMHKFNRLHLHLNDDQGWRFEVKALPRLTSIGGWRTQTRFNHWPQGDGTPHGGFYTQDQLRALVAHAHQRGITVVPEIDVPGHARAMLAAYPEFGEPSTPGQGVATEWGVMTDVLQLGESTMAAVEQIFTELLDVFDSPWIHVGGDECPTTQWQQSEAAAALAQRLGLEDTTHLQGWFTGHLYDWFTARGRTVIGWDEILDQASVPGAVVMAWQGRERGLRAIEAGHAVILASQSHYYFDFYPSDDPEEPYCIGGNTTWQRVVGADPREGLRPDQRGLLLGVHGAVWTEYVDSPARVEYQAFPRACALAEVAWHGPAEVAEFEARLGRHMARLDAAGVNYRPLSGPHPWQRGGTGRYARPKGHGGG